ncbi:unnamed protein product [Closterium sp. Naga37s-1]|nr:unnamed protein product [Closterium sp. Naga37s-1]
MAPCIALAPLIGIGFGTLSARGEFAIPSLSPSLSSLSVLVGIAVYFALCRCSPIASPQREIIGGTCLAVSFTAGALLQWLVQLAAEILSAPAPQRIMAATAPHERTTAPNEVKLVVTTEQPEDLPGAAATAPPAAAQAAAAATALPLPSAPPATTKAAAPMAPAPSPSPSAATTAAATASHAPAPTWLPLTALFARHSEQLREVFGVLIPATVASGMLQIATFTDLYFASFLPGTAAALGYANLLVMAPLGILSTALLVPLLPHFARLAHPKDRPLLKDSLRRGLVMAMAVTLSMTAFMLPLARPIVRIVFQRRSFDASATTLVSSLLSCCQCLLPVSFLPFERRSFDASATSLVSSLLSCCQYSLSLLPLSHVFSAAVLCVALSVAPSIPLPPPSSPRSSHAVNLLGSPCYLPPRLPLLPGSGRARAALLLPSPRHTLLQVRNSRVPPFSSPPDLLGSPCYLARDVLVRLFYSLSYATLCFMSIIYFLPPSVYAPDLLGSPGYLARDVLVRLFYSLSYATLCFMSIIYFPPSVYAPDLLGSPCYLARDVLVRLVYSLADGTCCLKNYSLTFPLSPFFPLLSADLLGSPCYLARDVLVRLFYSLADGTTPFLISTFAIAANAVLDFLFVSRWEFGPQGLVLATAAVNSASAVALLWLAHRRMGGEWKAGWVTAL